MENVERFGLPKIHRPCENVERVRQLVRSDRWLNTGLITELNVDRETVKKNPWFRNGCCTMNNAPAQGALKVFGIITSKVYRSPWGIL